MQPGSSIEAVELARSHEPKVATPVYERDMRLDEKHPTSEAGKTNDTADVSSLDAGEVTTYEGKPTAEDLATLHRVSGPIPWTAFTIAFVEFCERFGYYGTTVVCECNLRIFSRSMVCVVGTCKFYMETAGCFPICFQ